MNGTNYFKNNVDTYLRRSGYIQKKFGLSIKNVVLSISQWLPCPLAIWVFAFDFIKSYYNLLKKNYIRLNCNGYCVFVNGMSHSKWASTFQTQMMHNICNHHDIAAVYFIMAVGR